MAFMDRFKKQYVVKTRCFNCGYTQDCKVPKGITIDSYLKTEAAVCENCGNPTLRRIMNSPVQAPPAARRPIMQQRQMPRLPPLSPNQRRKLRQSNRPSRYRQQVPEEFQQEVEYPVDEPIHDEPPAPEWSAKPKKINFWTGKEEQ